MNKQEQQVIDTFKKHSDPEDVYNQAGRFSGLIAGSILQEFSQDYCKQYYEKTFKNALILYRKGFGEIFYDMSMYEQAAKKTWNRYKQNKKQIQEYQDYLRIQENAAKQYIQLSPHNLKNKDVLELQQHALETLQELMQLMTCTLFAEGIEHSILRSIYDDEEFSVPNFERFADNSMLLTAKTFAIRFNQHLLAKEEPYKKQWMFADYYGCESEEKITELVAERIKSLEGEDTLQEEIQENTKIIKKNQQKLDAYKQTITQKQRGLFEFAHLCVHIRDERKDTVQQLITITSNTIREILRQKEIDEELYAFCLLADFYDKTMDKDDYGNILEKRSDGCIVYMHDPTNYLLTTNMKQLQEEMHAFIDSTAAKEISGNVACKGKATGTARIILSQEQFSHFKQGDILITSMTRPEFVPLMKKAAAIITDEGGVSCHAAIISRELNIPCIIGTKNATRLLKDGDLVEVDANNGVVKLVNRNI